MTPKECEQVRDLLDRSTCRTAAIFSLIEHGTGYEPSEPETAIGLLVAGGVMLCPLSVGSGQGKEAFLATCAFLAEFVWDTRPVGDLKAAARGARAMPIALT